MVSLYCTIPLPSPSSMSRRIDLKCHTSASETLFGISNTIDSFHPSPSLSRTFDALKGQCATLHVQTNHARLGLVQVFKKIELTEFEGRQPSLDHQVLVGGAFRVSSSALLFFAVTLTFVVRSSRYAVNDLSA